MKIGSENLLENIISTKYDKAVSDMSKSLMQLKAGDSFKGVVVDIKQNSVTLKIDDNNVINAKSLVTPDLRIGEKASFTVKETNSGQIFVEISKTESENVNFIKELLNNAEMPATKENIELVKALIDNNMPVDKETISKGLYFKYANEEFIANSDEANQNFKNVDFSANKSEVLEKVLFLLKEEMPVGKVSVDTLNRLMDNYTGLKAEFLDIASKIAKMPDGNVKNKLLEIFDLKENFNSVEKIKQAISEKLFFKEDDLKSLETFNSKFEKIYEMSLKGSEILSETADETNLNLKQSFDNIKNDLDFMKNVDNYKDYIQIPININGKESDCELHIFKNSKRNGDFSKRASVLLSLDYFFIGKIDAFIEKIDKNLNFQFKCEKKETISLIKKNINELVDVLDNYGFKISSVTYKEKDEVFNVVKNKNEALKEKDVLKRRYSFDMRV